MSNAVEYVYFIFALIVVVLCWFVICYYAWRMSIDFWVGMAVVSALFILKLLGDEMKGG